MRDFTFANPRGDILRLPAPVLLPVPLSPFAFAALDDSVPPFGDCFRRSLRAGFSWPILRPSERRLALSVVRLSLELRCPQSVRDFTWLCELRGFGIDTPRLRVVVVLVVAVVVVAADDFNLALSGLRVEWPTDGLKLPVERDTPFRLAWRDFKPLASSIDVDRVSARGSSSSICSQRASSSSFLRSIKSSSN